MVADKDRRPIGSEAWVLGTAHRLNDLRQIAVEEEELVGDVVHQNHGVARCLVESRKVFHLLQPGEGARRHARSRSSRAISAMEHRGVRVPARVYQSNQGSQSQDRHVERHEFLLLLWWWSERSSELHVCHTSRQSEEIVRLIAPALIPRRRRISGEFVSE